LGLNIFFKRLYMLLTSFPFWMMTIFCNLAVFLSAVFFYFIEKEVNANINNFLDAVWWSFATVTTVGYGDITPQTIMGRILGIGLMIGGTGLFATYTAIFANSMLGFEFARLGRRVSKIKRDVSEIQVDEASLEYELTELKKSILRIEDKINKKNR